MIGIRTRGPIGEKYEKWLGRACDARKAQLAGCGQKAESPVFRQNIWQTFKELFLLEAFHQKCAFCEGKYWAGASLHVEHFRPKSEVTQNGKRLSHPGYFWLAYEWFNLILACEKCNRRKGTEFPVEGERVNGPSPNPERWQTEVEAERAALLSPYFDEPERHIGFTDIGTPFGSSKRGELTIKICGLDRPELVEVRLLAASERVNPRLWRALEKLDDGPFFGESEEFSLWLNHCAGVAVGKLQQRAGMRTAPCR